MGLRVAEIDQYAVAHVPGDEAIEPGDDLGDGAVIRTDDLAQILRVEPGGECGRADQIAEHHGQLPAFGLGWCRPRSRRRIGAELGDRVEQAPAVPDQSDAEILQILGRQARQYPRVDLVRAERRLVLLEPEPPQPIRDIHRRHAPVTWTIAVSYAFAGITRVSARLPKAALT